MGKGKTARRAKRKMTSMTMRLQIGNSPMSARALVELHTIKRMEEEHWGLFQVMMKKMVQDRLLLGHTRTWERLSRYKYKLKCNVLIMHRNQYSQAAAHMAVPQQFTRPLLTS